MSKGEGVAAEIRLQIVSGEIEVDTLLTENQVAKQFDVSRSVRDAFKITDGSTYSIRTHGC